MGLFVLSIIKHVTLKNIVAYDFRYDTRTYIPYGKAAKISTSLCVAWLNQMSTWIGR